MRQYINNINIYNSIISDRASRAVLGGQIEVGVTRPISVPPPRSCAPARPLRPHTPDLRCWPIAAARPSTTLARHDPALSPRPLRRHHRHKARRGAAQQHRPGAPCRWARLCPLLARRASQPRLGREPGARCDDRADRGRDEAHPRRLRRCDAAQPRAAGRGRALQDAGGVVSRPHRPRPRPRARHRSAPRPTHCAAGSIAARATISSSGCTN